MLKKDKTILRIINGGPNREKLFDCLRLGDETFLDLMLYGGIYHQRLNNVQILDVGRIYENCNDTWRIKFSYLGGQRIFHAFYSTNALTGYLCKTDEIQIWYPVVPAYRSLNDYELMALLQLGGMVFNQKFLKHIQARIIRGIKGIEYPSQKTGEIFEKIEMVKNLFSENLRKVKNIELVSNFREILG